MKRAVIRQMSKKRRAQLAELGIVYPTSTFKPKPKMATGKRPKDTGPDRVTADLVADRDQQACVVCGKFLAGARGTDWAIHHRKLRSAGVDNSPANLICVCTDDHTAIHASPEKARKAGWMLLGSDTPSSVAMAHSQFGWVTLTGLGGWNPIKEAIA